MLELEVVQLAPFVAQEHARATFVIHMQRILRRVEVAADPSPIAGLAAPAIVHEGPFAAVARVLRVVAEHHILPGRDDELAALAAAGVVQVALQLEVGPLGAFAHALQEHAGGLVGLGWDVELQHDFAVQLQLQLVVQIVRRKAQALAGTQARRIRRRHILQPFARPHRIVDHDARVFVGRRRGAGQHKAIALRVLA